MKKKRKNSKRKNNNQTFPIVFCIVLAFVVVLLCYCVNRQGDRVYYNAYILQGNKDGITAMVDGEKETYKVRGMTVNMKNCFADLTVRGTFVSKVKLKETSITGRVLSMDQDYIEIEGYGKKKISPKVSFYRKGKWEEKSSENDLRVGYQNASFFMEKDKICGVLIEKRIVIDKIRVLINTSEYKSQYHDHVLLEGEGEYTITYGKDSVKKKKAVDIKQDSSYFKNQNQITIQCRNKEKGIYLKNVKRAAENPVYYGCIYITKTEKGLLVVNEVDLETYLCSVVSSEMPSSFGVESLMVQSICARTYAVKQIENNSYGTKGAHLEDSTASQVYNNVSQTKEAAEAVQKTKGKIITFQGKPIEAYFFSTSCGVTTDGTVWGGKGKDYLKGVCLGEENVDLENLKSSEPFEKFIKDVPKGYDSSFPYFRWKFALQEKNIRNSLETQFQKNVGQIKNIAVTERGKGGIAKKLVVEGEKNQLTIEGELNLRKAVPLENVSVRLNDGTESRTLKMMPSAYVTVEKKGKKFYFYGGGYGHGVGISQNAVKTMAEQGMSPEEIIGFFYQDVEIKEIS